jgi:hypothetical protein
MAVHVFHGDRGGVGKSMLATSFGEYLLGKGRPLAVVETDTRNGDVGRYFDGVATVQRIDLRNPDGWIELLSYLEAEVAEDLIVALPAGIGGVFVANADKLLTALTALQRSMTVWWAMNRTPDSVGLLGPVATAFPKDSGVQIVAVRNLYFGEASKFARWNDGKARSKFLAAGGLETDFEALNDRVVDATFGALPAKRFSANGESGLKLGERIELGLWLERTTAHFEAIAARVGVGKR